MLLKDANDFIKNCGLFFEKSMENEEEKALIVEQLFNHLLPKRFKKLNEKLITVKAVNIYFYSIFIFIYKLHNFFPTM